MMLPSSTLALLAVLTASTVVQAQLGRKLHDPGKRTLPINPLPVDADPMSVPVDVVGQASLVNAQATSSAISAGVADVGTEAASVTEVTRQTEETLTIATADAVLDPSSPQATISASVLVTDATVPTPSPTLTKPTSALAPFPTIGTPLAPDLKGKTCGQKGTQALVQCLFDNSPTICTVMGGGCGVLASYLPISPDDESACYPDIQLAAEVCAQCGRTSEGYDLYNRYLNTCFALYPTSKVGKGTEGKSGAVPGDVAGDGVAEPAKDDSFTPNAAAIMGTEDGSPGGTKPEASGAATITGIATVTGLPAGSGAAVFEESAANQPNSIVAIEGSLTRAPTTPTPSALSAAVGTPTGKAAVNALAKVEEEGVPITDFDLGTPSVPAMPTSTLLLQSTSTAPATAKPELGLALGASQLFFAQVIDPTCLQKDDGCPTWQAALEVADGTAICAASNFKNAADCSACVGAAGRSDQATYRAHMEAYGWYRKNCTLATRGPNTAGASVAGVNAVEQVDVARATPGTAGLTTAERPGAPVALAANAPPLAPVNKSPKVALIDADTGALITKENGGGRRSELNLVGVLTVAVLAMIPMML